LITKPSQVGVDVDGTSYLLHRPTIGGCWPVAQSLWFGKVLPCLVVNPFFGGVPTLTSPHAAAVRSGPRALGPTLSGPITPCGVVLSSDHPYPRVCKLLRRFTLLWWRWFESLGEGVVSSMHVEGEKPLSPNLKGFGVQCLGLLGRGRDAYHCALPGGPLLGAAPLEPGHYDHWSAPGRPLGLMWCASLPSLVLFR
jgi:hypothetical protein